MECTEIRQQFVRYYEDHGFHFLPRSPMLQQSSPMSFVMSCYPPDIQQFSVKQKKYPDNKYVMVQECFRHFDVDSIGTDNLHLSLFEMPGAFTFGKNGRQNTIVQMWRLATEVMGIDPKRIWVSYFGGGRLGSRELPEDKSAYQAWKHVGLDENRLVGLGAEHNYWLEKGEILNKCGSNTELFYDMGSDRACGPGCLPGCDCGRFAEFCNSRFVSHTLRSRTGMLVPADAPHTETVIGTERIAMILQDAESVFDIKSYRPFIEIIHQFVTKTDLDPLMVKECERVIADHLKALFILIADGGPPPGRSGRARLVRVLIRRVITREIILGITSRDFLPVFISALSDSIDNNINVSPETEQKMKAYFESESGRFQKTIQRGQAELERILSENKGQALCDSQVFALEKEWGLPRLLTDMINHKRKKDSVNDGTETGVANELVEMGVPKDDIILAFHAPYKRQYTGFGVG